MKTRKSGNPRGFFYSVAVLVLVVPLAALIVYYASLSTEGQSADTSNVALSEASHFLVSLNQDFPRALRTTSQNTLSLAISTVVTQGQGFSDARSALKNGIIWGTFSGNQSGPPSTGNSYLTYWASRMQNLSRLYGLNATLTVDPANISVAQVSPFDVAFSANVTVFVQPLDDPESFNFSRVYSEQAVISITGLEDPLFTLNSRGRLVRVYSANATPVSGLSSLESHIGNKTYASNPMAPDFFSRLEGKLSPSIWGIETIINPLDFAAQDLPVYNQSHVDFLYFNATLPDSSHAVNSSAYPWIRLDCPHAQAYQVLNQTPGC